MFGLQGQYNKATVS